MLRFFYNGLRILYCILGSSSNNRNQNILENLIVTFAYFFYVRYYSILCSSSAVHLNYSVVFIEDPEFLPYFIHAKGLKVLDLREYYLSN